MLIVHFCRELFQTVDAPVYNKVSAVNGVSGNRGEVTVFELTEPTNNKKLLRIDDNPSMTLVKVVRFSKRNTCSFSDNPSSTLVWDHVPESVSV